MARTTLDLDKSLIDEALEITELPSKKAVIEAALRELIDARRRERLIAMVGSGAIDMTLEDLLEMRKHGWRDFSSR